MDNTEEELSQEPNNEFCFETDHLALRRNSDYNKLLRYIVKLEAQKVKALKDVEELADAHNKALENPLQFVESLQCGSVNFPSRQIIADLPDIDWNQYGIDSTLNTEDLRDFKPNPNSLDISPKVRGRSFTDSKPETFNQLWSCEEQKRLEELLVIYPEEAFESRRYKKIAKALGTRTPLQVMSRMQKYLTKLAKAGMAVPGRAPKGAIKEKNRSQMLFKKSTFFPQLHVPVKMEDPHSEHDEFPVSYEVKSGDRLMLEVLKAAKEQRLLDERVPVWQTKTMCVGCQKTRFLGARWTDNAGTDYCTDCVVKLLPTEKLIPIRDNK